MNRIKKEGNKKEKEGNAFKFKPVYLVLLLIIFVGILVVIFSNNNIHRSETSPSDPTLTNNASNSPPKNTSPQVNETIPPSVAHRFETSPLDPTLTNNASNSPPKNTSPQVNETIPPSVPKQEEKRDNIKINVVKFEPDNPCQGCRNLGNFANETIQQYFSKEYKSGEITYKIINYQDAKNIDIVKKYNILGSSLYIFVIKDGKEYVINANDMWNYVWDEKKYLEIFKNKLEKIKNV